MKICGLNKTTLLDYPGKVAATIFLGGCNLRCPFCHNSSLIHAEEGQTENMDPDEILSFLKKRSKILDGVCITGGEPTLSKGLSEFICEIKKIGLAVKLDTNGTSPKLIKELLERELLDYIAMDIKSSIEKYALTAGRPEVNTDVIRESVEIIRNSGIPYEFRTTVVKELHEKQDFVEIGKWLAGVKAYYLQAYNDSSDVLMPGFHSYSYDELEEIRQILLPYVENTAIRGVSS